MQKVIAASMLLATTALTATTVLAQEPIGKELQCSGNGIELRVFRGNQTRRQWIQVERASVGHAENSDLVVTRRETSARQVLTGTDYSLTIRFTNADHLSPRPFSATLRALDGSKLDALNCAYFNAPYRW